MWKCFAQDVALSTPWRVAAAVQGGGTSEDREGLHRAWGKGASSSSGGRQAVHGGQLGRWRVRTRGQSPWVLQWPLHLAKELRNWRGPFSSGQGMVGRSQSRDTPGRAGAHPSLSRCPRPSLFYLAR